MDRFIHTALNSLSNLRDSRVIQSQNLANQNTPGFRRDLQNEGKTHFLTHMNEATSAVALHLETGQHGFSQASGVLMQTNEPMDIAIADEGYFYINPGNGERALSRRGDLHQDANGTLINGAGEKILAPDMTEITLPPFRRVTVNDLGQIYIEPLTGEPGQTVLAGTIATVVPQEGLKLSKSEDGNIRTADGSPLPAPNQGARVVQGTLEGSNVNPVEELIASIETQRQFELGVRLVKTAQEMDESGSRLLRMPDA